MRNDIKFVYFDAGGVLFRWREVLEEIATKHGKKIDEIIPIFTKYDEAACKGTITSQQLWHGIYTELGIEIDKNFDFLSFSIERFTPIIETHNFIKKIAKRLPVGILTNAHLGVFDQVQKARHIPDVNYSVIIQSCLIGLIKPERKIYEHAQKKAKVAAKNILFIDDLEVNITGAKAFGWNTVLFDTDNPSRSIREIRKWIKN